MIQLVDLEILQTYKIKQHLSKMKVLIFAGTLETGPNSTSSRLSEYLVNKLQTEKIETQLFTLNNAGIPLLDTLLEETPPGVQAMLDIFLGADAHIWLAPLYHGSIPGVMKNCLDWLELSADYSKPYLSEKIIGFISWADGMQAMKGIDTMDAVAKSLRAWSLPYSIPIMKSELYSKPDFENIAVKYSEKLDLMVKLITQKRKFY
ncbi:hypothetical protein AAFH68_17130 [Flavobacterium sp. CGRL1]